MDFMIWMIAGAIAAILIPLGCYFLPARAKIVIDTPTSTARAELRLLWGLGPVSIVRVLPKKKHGTPLVAFSDGPRIARALMTPGIADAAFGALRAIYELKPRVVDLKVGLNLGDNSQNLVVQTAVQAALAAAPAALRQHVVTTRSEAPGAEISGEFKLSASPAQLSAIWGRFRNSRAAQEFRRRLVKKRKRGKRDAREVRVS